MDGHRLFNRLFRTLGSYMKQNKQSIAKWCKALRSGKYKQGKGSLQSKKGHCCLGVACELFIPKLLQERSLDGCLNFDVPQDQPYLRARPEHFIGSIDNDFYIKTYTHLIDLNDTGIENFNSFTFNEIADLLEAVYIHNVLD